jgi:hypothetical protein
MPSRPFSQKTASRSERIVLLLDPTADESAWQSLVQLKKN